MSGRGACRVCRHPASLTIDGRVYLHGPKDAPCPGSKQLPLGAALADAIGNLPTHTVDGRPAVLLTDLTRVLNQHLAVQGLPPMDGFDD